MRFRFQQGSRSDVGCVRTVNEDACLLRGEDGLWAVADGMGGHARGQWASAQIMAELEQAILADQLDRTVDATETALVRANASICRSSEADGQVIGSTVNILLIREHRYAVLWAGDSRVYLVRDNELHLLTTDHSQVEQMIASGLLTREEAEGHPMAHMLSRAVGVRSEVVLDRRFGDVRSGDVFLLCSDGLTRMIHDDEILSMLRQHSPGRAAAALVDVALARGAADNVTVVVVGCDETTLVAAGG